MGYDVLIELGQKALDEAIDHVKEKLTESYNTYIVLYLRHEIKEQEENQI